MTGYVAMSRDWQEHDIFGADEFSRRDAWAWLIAQAAWKPSKVRIKGTTVALGRGELCFSIRFLAAKWRWSKSKVDRFLSTLRSEGMIATRSKTGTTAGHPAGQGQAIITICNYDKFQSPLKGERDNAEPQTGTTAGQQRDKEEEGNKFIPLSNDNGAVDLEKVIFDQGVGYLASCGVKPERSRPFLGKLKRDYGAGAVIEAIGIAQRQNVIDPLSFLPATLKQRAPKPRPVIPI